MTAADVRGCASADGAAPPGVQRLSEAAPAPSPVSAGEGVTPDELVWVAIKRRGTTYHRIGPLHTGCGRSLRLGAELTAAFAAEDLAGEPCPRCWPTPDGAAVSSPAAVPPTLPPGSQ